MTLQVVIESEEPDKIKEPEILRKIDNFQQYADQSEIVGSSQSMADMIKEMNRFPPSILFRKPDYFNCLRRIVDSYLSGRSTVNVFGVR